MMTLQDEIDQIILRTISEYGYEAIPYDYFFLKRYDLMSIFLVGVKNSMLGLRSSQYDNILKGQVYSYIQPVSLFRLAELVKTKKKKEISLLFYNNELYLKKLRKELRYVSE